MAKQSPDEAAEALSAGVPPAVVIAPAWAGMPGGPVAKPPTDGGDAAAPRRAAQPWWRHPSTLITAALVVLLAELVLVRCVGWWPAVAINAAALVAVLAARAAWPELFKGSGPGSGSRSRGGLLGRLTGLGSRSRGGSGPGSGGSRSRGLLGRLMGRGSGRGGPGSGPGSGSRSRGGLLGRLTGGRGGSRSRGHAGGRTAGHRTGAPGGAAGRRRGLFGRSGGGGAGAAGGRGRGGSGAGSSRKGGGSGGGRGKGGGGSSGGPLAAWATQAGDKAKAAWTEGTQGANPITEAISGLIEGWGDPATAAEPAGQAAEETNMSDVQDMSNEDADLFRWAATLGAIPNILDEASVPVAAAQDAATAVADGLANMAAHGSTGLPADDGLVAEVEILAGRARAVEAEIETALNALRGIQIEAEGLSGRFESAHEADLARLRGERAPRDIERKADVGTADI